MVNQKKCSLGQNRIKYLGHIISRSGVEADPRKIHEMKNWPKLRDIRDLRGFPGSMGYYWKFVKGYGKMAEPLTNLCKKNSFKWGVDTQRAFDALKSAMITVSVLVMSNFTKEFIVETDALGVGEEAVLMQ